MYQQEANERIAQLETELRQAIAARDESLQARDVLAEKLRTSEQYQALWQAAVDAGVRDVMGFVAAATGAGLLEETTTLESKALIAYAKTKLPSFFAQQPEPAEVVPFTVAQRRRTPQSTHQLAARAYRS